MMRQGIYANLSNEDYHGDKTSISRSALMDFMDSPYKYWAKHLNPERPQSIETASMGFGSLFHMYVLENDLYHQETIMAPKKVLLKDVGRMYYDAYKADLEELESTRKIIVSHEDTLTLQAMFASLMRNTEAMELLTGGHIEVSMFWQDEDSGLMLKARPDVLHRNIIVDLKTCDSASTRAFQMSMAKYGYHIQGAMIREGNRVLNGVDIPNVINICVEKSYPHEVAIKIISESALAIGHDKFKSALLDLSSAIAHNQWKSYEPEIVELPSWST